MRRLRVCECVLQQRVCIDVLELAAQQSGPLALIRRRLFPVQSLSEAVNYSALMAV